MARRKRIDPSAWAERLAAAQVAHPWRFLLPALLITVVAGLLASGLRFDSSYEALLPEGAAEVQNTDQVRERTGGFRQLVVAIEGSDPEQRLAFGRQLVERLQGLPQVRATDLEFPVDFFEQRAIWLMEVPALDELVVAVHRAVQATTFPFGTTDPHTAWSNVERIVQRERDRLPYDGDVLESDDGRYTFLLVVPRIRFSDMEAGEALLAAIDAQVAGLDPAGSGISVRYAGNLAIVQEQHHVMRADLRRASVVALLFGVLVIGAFTRRAAAPLVVGGSLLVGIAWTFGLARLWIGHLNIITGFLVAVLIGLGIDFGIHLLVRYQQERAALGASARSAVLAAVRGTLPPASIGALTTAGTFLSFMAARFRGFSEFGLVAGLGVLLTLVSVFVVLPPLLLLADRWLSRPGGLLPVPPQGFLRPALAWPVVVLLGLVALAGVTQVGSIPFRNDYKLLRGESPATEFIEYVDGQLGVGFNPAVFLVGDLQQAEQLERIALEQQRRGLTDGSPSRVGRVLSGARLVPADVEQRRARVEKLEAVVTHPSLDRYAAADDAKAQRLRQARRLVQSEPWSLDDLPQELRRRFVTPAGDALLVYLWPDQPNYSDWQAAEWEDELKLLSARLSEEGIPHQLADETLLIAWVYRTIQADGPLLLLLAALVVAVFLLLDQRRLRHAALVALPLAVGMFALVALLGATGMEVNMFNLIVLPSLIGIGVDNAVHIWHRYREEGPGSLELVLRRTGAAAALASVTTAVGFGSSLLSHHVGLRTMGWLAILGIACTFVSATLFFPALLSLLERRRGGPLGRSTARSRRSIGHQGSGSGG